MTEGYELLIAAVAAGGIRAAVPLFLAALGEVFAERSGVINLGIEGVMLVGAVTGVAATLYAGSPWAGVVAAALVGAGLAACHGAAVVWFGVNQIASGIAIIVLGTGLSGLVGIDYVGRTFEGFPILPVPVLSDIPFLGTVLFRHDALTYLTFAAIPAGWWLLYRTRWGLEMRAVGDDAEAAAAIGLDVRTLRTSAVVFGGALAGVAGAYLSLAYSQLWQENMVAGRGLIALALVVFGGWMPGRVYLGALIFGTISAVQLRLQTIGGSAISPFLLATLPYVLTIAVLVWTSRLSSLGLGGAPRELGRAFTKGR
ncbi:MAG TPA: ABC transporter permease [Allosphingosinicella sp.]|jgi:simple sugar transport system permease protein